MRAESIGVIIHDKMEKMGLSLADRLRVVAAILGSECAWMSSDLQATNQLIDEVAQVAKEAMQAMEDDGASPWQQEARGADLRRGKLFTLDKSETKVTQ